MTPHPEHSAITVGQVSPFPVHLHGGVVRTVLNLHDGLPRFTPFSSMVVANQEAPSATEAVLAFPFRSFCWDHRLYWKRLAAFTILFYAEHRHLFSLPWPASTKLFHLHYFGDYYLHFAAARYPYVITLHGSDVRLDLRQSALLRAIAWTVFKRARRICFPSQGLCDDFLALFPTCRDRCRIMLNGTELASARAIAQPLPDRFILCTGNMQPVKGQDVLIRAFARLALRYPDLHLVLAGDGPAKAPWQALAADLSLQDRILFLGSCSSSEVSYLLQKCALYVQPSRNEGGHPLAVMEAMLAGKPVVARAASGLQEMIEHEHSGLLAQNEDPDGLAEQMERIILSPSLNRHLAENGQHKALTTYTLQALSLRYAALYQEVLNEAF
jgi:glycosyltransferase involved in cell wall biosynthesis